MKHREVITEETLDHGNPNRDFREFKAVRKAAQYQQARKAGGGAREQERRRRQIAKGQRSVDVSIEVEACGIALPDEQ